jgi:folate-binding protein YgfZ
MITDARVLAFSDAFLLGVRGPVVEALRARLDLFIIAEDVTVSDQSDALARLTVVGPAAADVVAATVGDVAAAELRDLPEDRHEYVPAAAPHSALHLGQPGSVLVAATNDAGPGLDLYVPAPEKTQWLGRLAQTGAPQLDPAEWMALRLEAGRPLFGVDMDAETIPLEAGIEDRAINDQKGCYVGQEVIVRVRDRGHGRVARRLMGLVPTDPDPGPAATLVPGDVLLVGDREVGRVTSAAWSPRARRSIGFGYVHRDFATIGELVQLRRAEARILLRLTARNALLTPDVQS